MHAEWEWTILTLGGVFMLGRLSLLCPRRQPPATTSSRLLTQPPISLSTCLLVEAATRLCIVLEPSHHVVNRGVSLCAGWGDDLGQGHQDVLAPGSRDRIGKELTGPLARNRKNLQSAGGRRAVEIGDFNLRGRGRHREGKFGVDETGRKNGQDGMKTARELVFNKLNRGLKNGGRRAEEFGCWWWSWREEKLTKTCMTTEVYLEGSTD